MMGLLSVDENIKVSGCVVESAIVRSVAGAGVPAPPALVGAKLSKIVLLVGYGFGFEVCHHCTRVESIVLVAAMITMGVRSF